MESIVLMPPKSFTESVILTQLNQMELYGVGSRDRVTLTAENAAENTEFLLLS